MAKFGKKKKGLPPVSTASLPDIVFMLLFFFMVTTTMRKSDLKIENPVLPSATEVKKLEHKSLVTTIFVGKAKETGKYGSGYNRIQLNDKISTPEQIPAFIENARSKVMESEIPFMTTSIKADRQSNVGTLSDIRLKLRDVNALKLSLSTQKGSSIKK